ncbi:class I SAM-dependent methyltransferase [Candidatus Roizmanbacteria bacterium]|nr:class I SAM-dependent methyltransferase [Candidatus Roizmanbacteria bacterium]
MLRVLLYWTALLTELGFFFAFSVYVIFLIYSHTKGSPYVPSKQKELAYILSEAGLKKGMVFYDLGSGDGRAVMTAVSKYEVRGIGVDINPLLIWEARLKARFKNLKQISFIKKNIDDVNLTRANVVYVFLMPDLLKKLKIKFESELKKKVTVISHGFKIEGWDNKLVKTIPRSPFPTYFYVM